MNQNLSEKELNSSIYGAFFVKENRVEEINVNEIEARIEKYSISDRLLNVSDLCCANLILLFAMSLKSFKSVKETLDCQTFLCYLFQEFTIFRKYYSILFKIIYRLYQDKNNTNAALCYFPCINSIRNNKIVPNEELMIIINEFNKSDIMNVTMSEEEEEKEADNDDPMKNKFKDITISSDNLYIHHNFTANRFVKEEEILNELNMNKTSEQVEIILKNGEILTPKIRFKFGPEENEQYECFFLSQKSILEKLINEYKIYIENLDENKIGTQIMLEACLNIFIFMRNNEKFKSKDDIFDTLKSIFRIFINRLFMLKNIKENI